MKKNILITFLLISLGLILALLNITPLAVKAAESNFIFAWSSNSFVPPESEIRSLPTTNSLIKVVVLPTKPLSPDPEKLYYRWYLDEEPQGWATGQGKSAMEFRVTKWLGGRYKVECLIYDQPGYLSQPIWQSSLTLKVVSPEILLQNKETGLALPDRLVTSPGQDLTFVAFPLFFNIKQISDLNYEWQLENQVLTPTTNKNLNELNLKIAAGELTSSLFKKLTVMAKHKINKLQAASLNLLLEIK
ncbi:MAG: hypothetical protein AAB724_02580 [Patescibacteria group bacterium]